MQLLWMYVRRYHRRWLWGSFMLLCTNAAVMPIPMLLRYAVDGIRAGAPSSELRELAVELVLLALGAALFRTLSRVHIFYAARDVELDLRCHFFRHLSTLEPAFFANYPVGDLMSRATNDLTQVRLMLGPGLLNVVNTTIVYAAAVPLMLAISTKLTLVTLAVFPVGFLLMRSFGRRLYRRTRAQQQVLGRISDTVQESLAGAHVVRAFAIEEQRQAALEALNEEYYRAAVGLTRVRSGMFKMVMSLGNLGILLAVVFGAADALRGRITAGQLVALVEYMALLAWPTFALGWVVTTWQRGRASFSRLAEVLAIAPKVRSGKLRPLTILPSIEVRGLRLDLDGRRVLDGVQLSVAAGRVLGVVGTIGSGKTVLLASLLRLLDVPQDRVFVGGYDVTKLDLDVLRTSFAYVPQTHTLFSRSLRDNVAFGVPSAGDEEVLAALTRAAFTADLKMLPRGLDTPVGERGITLSGGQKQRVAIARALLLDAPILVLDDALSSVDADTEAQILSHLVDVRKDRTTLIAAHRVSAVQHADEIVVLAAGHIIERGRHEELLAKGGWYAEVARKQALENAIEGGGRNLGSVA